MPIPNPTLLNLPVQLFLGRHFFHMDIPKHMRHSCKRNITSSFSGHLFPLFIKIETRWERAVELLKEQYWIRIMQRTTLPF